MIFVEIFGENLVFDQYRGIFPPKDIIFLASLEKFPELNFCLKNSPNCFKKTQSMVYALALSYYQCKTYTSEKGKVHWQEPMVTPITAQMIEANKLTFSADKNLKDWPQIIMQATSQRAVERPSSVEARERLGNKYLALLARVGRSLGLNKKKPNFKWRLAMIIGIPLVIISLIIVLVTLKCPSNKITSTPWKPVWFGGCYNCASDEHLDDSGTKNVCVKNECFCNNGFLFDSSAGNRTSELSDSSELPCNKNGAEKCASCYTGFHLYRDNKKDEISCKLNECICGETVLSA